MQMIIIVVRIVAVTGEGACEGLVLDLVLVARLFLS